VNLKEDLEARFDIPVFVENDIKLAAFAENRLGEGKHHRHLVYVEVNDYGIASGIILDNHIVRGALGLAGEIGYSVVPGAEWNRGTSSGGYLESKGSLGALVDQVVSRIEGGESSAIAGRSPVARDVFEAAAKGDHLCGEVVRDGVALLSTVAVNLVLTVNPEVFVVGGDVFDMPGAAELLLEPLRRRMEEVLPFEPPIVEFSTLGSDACVTGAALFGVESILLGKYPFAFDYVGSGDSRPFGMADG
jgi:predicted NBD/HSP70 family sugar kinase